MALERAFKAVDMEEPYKVVREIRAKKATTKQQKLLTPAMALKQAMKAVLAEEPR